MSEPLQRVAISGASGYVGGKIAAHLAAHGWSIAQLARKAADPALRFKLGEDISPDALRGCHALVHCAYDFAPLHWDAIRAANVDGSRKLFEAARAAGVRRIIFISTISAFREARALYGQAKLEIEDVARQFGAVVLRPGLVWGPNAGGMFGRLLAQAKSARVVPLPSGGANLQYLVHQDDIAASVHAAIDQPWASAEPVTVAHEAPLPLGEIVQSLARTQGRKVTLIRAPWRLVWLGLKSFETVGLALNLRSDSLVSMVYQNPAPSLNAREVLGVACRAFNPQLALA